MNLRVWFIAITSAVGGFLFGYEIGIINQVLLMDSFRVFFGLSTTQRLSNGTLQDIPGADNTTGNIVSLFLAGCIPGAVAVTVLADSALVGRKRSILGGATLFGLGGILQGLANSIGMLYAGRFFCGLAVGILSGTVPLYIAEVSPTPVRGRLTTIQQLMITIGIAVANIINAILAHTIDSFNDQLWRTALGLQAAPGFFLLFAMFFLPYSPRWLVNNGRDDEATKTIAWIYGEPESSAEVKEEFRLIKEGHEEEKAIGSADWSELLRKGILNRVIIGIVLQFFQQWTGINAAMYYSSALFVGMGFSKDTATTVNTTLQSIINVLATFPGMYLIERPWAGRRKLLYVGGLGMAFCMWMLVMWVRLFENTEIVNSAGETVANPDSSSGKAFGYMGAIFMYVYIIFFASTWGPVVWVYQSEIFPLRVRGKGAGLATTSNWINNLIIAKVWPYAQNLGAYQYVVFGCTGIAMAAYVYFFVPETRGRSLEDMDEIFGVEKGDSKGVWREREKATIPLNEATAA